MDRAEFTFIFTIPELFIYQCFVQTTMSDLCHIVRCCDETEYLYFSFRIHFKLIGFAVVARWCISWLTEQPLYYTFSGFHGNFCSDDGCFVVFHMMQNKSLLHGVKSQKKKTIIWTIRLSGRAPLCVVPLYSYNICDEYYSNNNRHVVI
jgi:hypothetical protein